MCVCVVLYVSVCVCVCVCVHFIFRLRSLIDERHRVQPALHAHHPIRSAGSEAPAANGSYSLNTTSIALAQWLLATDLTSENGFKRYGAIVYAPPSVSVRVVVCMCLLWAFSGCVRWLVCCSLVRLFLSLFALDCWFAALVCLIFCVFLLAVCSRRYPKRNTTCFSTPAPHTACPLWSTSSTTVVCERHTPPAHNRTSS